MNRKNTLIILVLILIAAGFSFWFVWKNMTPSLSLVTNFEECAARGYPVAEIYPRQCQTPDGKIFIEQIVQKSPEIIPGVKSLLYQNSEFGFDLWYPEGSDVHEKDFNGFLSATSGGAAVAGIYLESSFFQGTNLGEAAVAVGISPDPQSIAKCASPVNSQEEVLGTESVNGKVFNVFTLIGAAAGNTYESKIYRIVQRGSCYEIVEMLHSGNIGNYPAGTVTEFDKAKFSGILEKMVQTFVFTSAASGATGIVTLGPTCPVEKIPPDPACVPQSYETSITITKAGFSKDITGDFTGHFSVDFDPGTYQFQAKGGTVLPRCNPATVEIKSQSFIWVSISCDTGIR